jgi:acetyl esterase/lipase
VRALRDVPYVTAGHERQKLDLFLPEHVAGAPLAVWIHGGGWQSGSKEGCPAMGLLDEGYVVASLNYRYSQQALFPAQIEDCKAAIRWLRGHASTYGYDGEHIGAWGASAGGHLVALLGTTGTMRDFDVGENLDVSSRVQAVIDWFGPTDFPRFNNPANSRAEGALSLLTRLFGGPLPTKLDLARRASPATWTSADSAPTLIMHGTRDTLVPLDQSEWFAERLKAAGAEVTLDVLNGAGHGGKEFFAPEKLNRMKGFFDRHLKPAP